MATRSRTTFKKRQKEMARAEKQREKQAKRLQRKEGGPEPEATAEDSEAGVSEEVGVAPEEAANLPS